MGNQSGDRRVLTEPFSPTAAVSLGRGVDVNGNQIAAAGARAYGVATDDYSADDAALAVPQKKKLACVTLGTALAELGGAVAKGDRLTTDNVGRFVTATAGQEVSAIAREGGALGDYREVYVLAAARQVASAAIAAPAGGATVDAEARTAINAIRAALTAQGITL